jgi:hypothetical protein
MYICMLARNKSPWSKGIENERISMTENKVIGFVEFFGKVNAIVVKDHSVELKETEIKKSDCCWID